jgi:hypothetical protein
MGTFIAAIRQEQPAALILDDAFADQPLLGQLIQLRRESGLRFRLIVRCGPGEAERLADVLSVPTTSCRTLQPLTRDEVVAVVRGTRLNRSTHLVRAIVDQAAGQPGLATTLARLCLGGDVRAVALGDALSRIVRQTFDRLVGQNATEVLAAPAVGGASGMSLSAVASALQQSIAEVRRVVVNLLLGAVGADVGDGRLAVHPSGLRSALVRSVVFAGAASLPVESFGPAPVSQTRNGEAAWACSLAVANASGVR